MSGIISSTTLALTAVVSVFATAFPEVQQAATPVFDAGNEFATYALGLLISISGLAVLTMMTGLARD